MGYSGRRAPEARLRQHPAPEGPPDAGVRVVVSDWQAERRLRRRGAIRRGAWQERCRGRKSSRGL